MLSSLLCFALFAVYNTNLVLAGRCDRSPAATEAERSDGNNGFHVEIYVHPINMSAPAPEGYIPGELYTVTIEGHKTKYTEQTFRGFTLVGVSEKNTSMPVGEFKILDFHRDTLRMSSRCLQAVTQESLFPKTSIEVVWQAPSSAAKGCVLFKATVLEYRDSWFMDDGPLTRKLCPLEVVWQAPSSAAKGCVLFKATVLEYRDSWFMDDGPLTRKLRPLEVVWQAPSSAAKGCVLFKATALEYRDSWFMDDGPLTRILCPLEGFVHEEQQNEDEECCACDEANYELVFTGLWSRITHPKDFPRS